MYGIEVIKESVYLCGFVVVRRVCPPPEAVALGQHRPQQQATYS
jgi:hypothetical protein